MAKLPRVAQIAGVLMVLPFLWGALTQLDEDAAALGSHFLGARFIGPYIGLTWGTVVLAFQSGILWTFASRAGRGSVIGSLLALIPAVWAFVMVGGGPVSASINLMAGFVALLVLDWSFWRWGVAPRWWMRFRLLPVSMILACLALTAFG
ncbi:MAG: DUF3429 domain-containing protein [Pseudorhodobacter sp.]